MSIVTRWETRQCRNDSILRTHIF